MPRTPPDKLPIRLDSITLRLTPRLLRALAIQAKREHRSRNTLIGRACLEYLRARYPKRSQKFIKPIKTKE